MLPSFALAIWLALPLARSAIGALLGAAALTGIMALGLTALGAESGGNVSKLATYGLLGFAFVALFEELCTSPEMVPFLTLPAYDRLEEAAGS